MGVVVGAMLPFALRTPEFGSVISAETAKTMPEFWDGRTQYFYDDWQSFWLWGNRTGLFARIDRLPAFVQFGLPGFDFGFLVPLVALFCLRNPWKAKFVAVKTMLAQLMLSALGFYTLAHAIAFRIYLPSRYVKYPLRIALAISLASIVVVIFQTVVRWLGNDPGSRAIVLRCRRMGLAVGLFGLLVYPLVFEDMSVMGYVTGKHSRIYDYLANQPNNSLVATLTREGDMIPSLSRRPILASYEYGLPYHLEYYRPFRQRAIDTITAQYSSDLEALLAFQDRYQVAFWLLERNSFEEEYLNDRWLLQFEPATSNVREQLQQGQISMLAKLADSCTVVTSEPFRLVDARCLRDVSLTGFFSPEP